MFACKAGAYMNEAPFRCSTLGQAPGHSYKHKTKLVIFARYKNSKKFYNIGSWCLSQINHCLAKGLWQHTWGCTIYLRSLLIPELTGRDSAIKGWLLASLANIRLLREWLEGTNALAYYDAELITTLKCFIVQGINLQSFIEFLTHKWAHKATAFVTGKPFQPSVM